MRREDLPERWEKRLIKHLEENPISKDDRDMMDQ